MKQERIKDKLEVSALIGIFLLSILAITPAHADEIKFGFKNPSFSGVGTGAHYLTIENQEFSRKKAIQVTLVMMVVVMVMEAVNEMVSYINTFGS